MLIIEGPDGSGKTTLITKMVEEFGLTVAPRVKDKQAQTIVPDLKQWVADNLEEGFQYRIFDRHRLISEFIYGPLIRSEQEPGFTDLIWVSNSLWLLYRWVEPVIIYCLPPLEVVRANIQADHENAVVADHVDALYAAYVHRASLDWNAHPDRVIIYDYTTDGQEVDPLGCLRNLINYAKGRTE